MKLRLTASLLAALLGGALAVVTGPGSSGASTRGVSPVAVSMPETVLPAPSGAVALGSVSGRTVLRLDVTLKLRDPGALAAFIRQLSDRSSPHFGQFLRPGQFGPMFGATLAQVAEVDAALRAEGLSPGPVTRNRLAIPVTTSAAVADQAFGVALIRYRLPGGRIAYSNSRAPRLPAAAAPLVQGVLGLSDVYLPQSLAVRPAPPGGRQQAGRGVAGGGVLGPAAAGPHPCTAASNAASANGSFTADQLAAYYAMSPLYGLGDRGKGVSVALAEFEPNTASDITAYRSCYGIKTAVTYTKVDGGSGTGAGSGEAALDIEDVMGLAPGVAIHVYQAPNGGTQDTFGLYNAIISSDTSQVVSTSWGLCQADSGSSLISSEASLFAEAATQGQTVIAAAGDDGSTDCYTGSGSSVELAVHDPASQPYVIGVGGTSVGTSAETVWNDSSFADGAGGGGRSSGCMPAYQDQAAIPGLISKTYSEKSSSCTKVPYLRQVPDVSADADPQTGYTYFHSGAWSAIGGTSAAAPLWAAVAALTDASPFCKYYGSGDAGLRPQGLYAMVANDHAYVYDDGEALHDITQGNNDYTPSGYTAGLFPATPGYDMASGLGTPLAVGVISGQVSTFYPGITALMCWQYGRKLRKTTVTGIRPRAGPASKRQTVTITGTGFLPVAGADMASVGTKTVSARCSTTTKCTITLPVLKPGTYSIQIKAEDLTLSPATTAARYRAVAAPTVSSVSPTHGRPGGGNTVTIHGSHFVGVTAVHFGSKKAGHVVVISATKLTVTAPSGSGTAAVTVTATGGTSAVSAGSHYRY